MMATRTEEAPRLPGAGERVLQGNSRWGILPFLGPAFIACVAYMDPGNFATNIAGGSKFGFTLVWVIVASNLMAMLIQTLSAKLGIATGRNLPEICRERFSRRTSVGLWLQAEAIAMATDLAEFLGNESVLLAVGILGATVMPHVIYLHSALTQHRIVPRNDDEARMLYKYTRIDVLIAMVIAGLINMSMLVVAATVFFGSGLTNVASLDGAHRTLEPILGGASSVLFALALTASGLSSSTVGTMSGQVVMQGFIRRRIPLFMRRIVTMIPAFVVIGLGLDPSRTLVISQVVLSFGIPFALIPLVMFTSRRDVMGVLVNRRLTIAAAAVVATVISGLYVFLLAPTFGVTG